MTRYQTAVLTVIAICLVYLCVVLTPSPRVMAQAPPPHSGDAPGRVYVVGWIDATGGIHHLPSATLKPVPGGLPVYRTNP